MQSSFFRKALFALTKAFTSPRSTLSWIVRGHLAKDQVFVSHTYWFTGALPRMGEMISTWTPIPSSAPSATLARPPSQIGQP